MAGYSIEFHNELSGDCVKEIYDQNTPPTTTQLNTDEREGPNSRRQKRKQMKFNLNYFPLKHMFFFGWQIILLLTSLLLGHDNDKTNYNLSSGIAH